MTIRIAINGFGRIGRNVLRALHENYAHAPIQVVAINDLARLESAAHLLKYDSVHGRFNASVEHDHDTVSVNGHRMTYLSEKNPLLLPWAELGVDYVLECTGRFTDRNSAAQHLVAGAHKVLVSAPCKNADATIVYGVNHEQLDAEMQVISNASCTTNCLAPIAQVLDQAVGIERGCMTTIHSVTNDQNLLDLDHPDLYRARAATQSMIPTKTGAASAVGLVLPQLNGKLDGMAVRVPTLNVSLVDFTFIAARDTQVGEINAAIKQASSHQLAGVLDYVTAPLVSVDFNHQSASSIFDATQTRVIGRLVKVMAWYDNEWGFSNRMLDNLLALRRVQMASEQASALFA